MYTKEINGFGVQLKPLQQTQVEQVRQWRNHPDVAKFMCEQTHITQEQQQLWFNDLTEKIHAGFWLAYYRGEVVGVINVKAETGQAVEHATELEAGLYMVPDSRYKNSLLAFCPSLALIEHFFSKNTQRVVAKVKSTNSAALRYNQTLGYQRVNANNNESVADEVTMQLDLESFSLAKDKLKKIIRF